MNKNVYLVLGYCSKLEIDRLDLDEVSVANVQDVLYAGLDAGSAQLAVIDHTSNHKERSVLMLVWCPESGLSLHSIDNYGLGRSAIQAFDYDSDVEDIARAMCARWVSGNGEFSVTIRNTFPMNAERIGR